jgi:hypothetical protein
MLHRRGRVTYRMLKRQFGLDGHEGLTEVLTNDRYFTQEGFHILFR